MYVVGSFSDEVDFDPGPGVESHTPTGAGDAYVLKYDPDGGFCWVRVYGSENDFNPDNAKGIDIDPWGNPVITGKFYGVVDFDPGPDTYSLDTVGVNDNDPYLLRYNPDGWWD